MYKNVINKNHKWNITVRASISDQNGTCQPSMTRLSEHSQKQFITWWFYNVSYSSDSVVESICDSKEGNYQVLIYKLWNFTIDLLKLCQSPGIICSQLKVINFVGLFIKYYWLCSATANLGFFQLPLKTSWLFCRVLHNRQFSVVTRDFSHGKIWAIWDTCLMLWEPLFQNTCPACDWQKSQHHSSLNWPWEAQEPVLSERTRNPDLLK